MRFHCESLYTKDAQQILLKIVIIFEKKVLGSPTWWTMLHWWGNWTFCMLLMLMLQWLLKYNLVQLLNKQKSFKNLLCSYCTQQCFDCILFENSKQVVKITVYMEDYWVSARYSHYGRPILRFGRQHVCGDFTLNPHHHNLLTLFYDVWLTGSRSIVIFSGNVVWSGLVWAGLILFML